MRIVFIAALMLIVTIGLVSCGSNNTKEKEPAKEEAGHEEQENTHTATFTDEQIKSIGIATGNIEEKQLTASLKANGILRVPNQNKASVNSVYSGVIRSLLVQPGNTVRKGQTIATISNPSFIQVQSDYLNTTAKIKLAELEVKRQQELNAGNAGALKNLQAAETELRTLQTVQCTLAQQIRLMGINPGTLSNGKLISILSITSPINGIVSNVKVQIGSYIDVSTPIAEIVDNSQLHLDLFVYEKDLPKVKNDQLIHFTLTNNPNREYDAEIYSLGSSFEGESKAVSVHARVKGDKTGLIDGMNITAAISLEKKTVPAVPSDAIVTYQGQDYVFIVTGQHTENERHQEAKTTQPHTHEAEEQHDHQEQLKVSEKGITFERIPVAKGATDVGYTEIAPLKPIPAGAKVVVKGAFFVLAKMTNTCEHEH